MSYPPPPDGEPSESSGDQPGQPPGQGQTPPGYGYDPNQPSYGYDPNQPPYGYGASQPYGYPQPGSYQPGYYRPEHPGAVPSLVLGIVALGGGFICLGLPFALGPWAWIKGKRTMDEIDASGGQLGGRGMAQGGYICGIVATVLLAVILLLVVLAIVVAVVAGTAAA